MTVAKNTAFRERERESERGGELSERMRRLDLWSNKKNTKDTQGFVQYQTEGEEGLLVSGFFEKDAWTD